MHGMRVKMWRRVTWMDVPQFLPCNSAILPHLRNFHIRRPHRRGGGQNIYKIFCQTLHKICGQRLKKMRKKIMKKFPDWVSETNKCTFKMQSKQMQTKRMQTNKCTFKMRRNVMRAVKTPWEGGGLPCGGHAEDRLYLYHFVVRH